MSVQGINEALEAIQRIADGLAPGGSLDQALEAGAQEGVDYASIIAPRLSGALQQAQRVLHIGNEVSIGIDPSATNPTGQHPAVYGPIVAKRVFDFYAQVVDDRGTAVVDKVFDEFIRAIQ